MESVREAALGSLVDENSDDLVVFNSLNWPRTVLIDLPEGCYKGKHAENVPMQEIDGRHFAEIDVPSCGWVSLKRYVAPDANKNDCGSVETFQYRGDRPPYLSLPQSKFALTVELFYLSL